MMFVTDRMIEQATDQLELIEALRCAFVGPATTPSRMHESLPGEDGAKLLVMPSWSGREAIGVKVVTVMPDNPQRGLATVGGLYMLMEGECGRPLAVMSARALTAVRTAGVSALASKALARTDAEVILMIGTGALAPYLIAAHLAVRPLRKLILWGRDPAKCERLRSKLADLPVELEIAGDLSDALGRAHIVCSATSSSEPLVQGDRIRAGTHVDLVGSFTPAMREADDALFRRGRLIVDTATAMEESGDVLGPLRAGLLPAEVPSLSDLLRDPGLQRQSSREITIFKAVGTGLADLAAARYIHARLAPASPHKES